MNCDFELTAYKLYITAYNLNWGSLFQICQFEVEAKKLEVMIFWLIALYRHINNALKFDEQDKGREALQLYHKGPKSFSGYWNLVFWSFHSLSEGRGRQRQCQISGEHNNQINKYDTVRPAYQLLFTSEPSCPKPDQFNPNQIETFLQVYFWIWELASWKTELRSRKA